MSGMDHEKGSSIALVYVKLGMVKTDDIDSLLIFVPSSMKT